MYIDHELLRREEKWGVSDACQGSVSMCPVGAGGLSYEVNAGKVLNRNIFEPAAVGHLLQQAHHRLHARIRARDDRDEEVGEAKM